MGFRGLDLNFQFATKALDVGLCHRGTAGTVITRCCFCLAPKEDRAVGDSERAPSFFAFSDGGFLSVLPAWLGALDYLPKII